MRTCTVQRMELCRSELSANDVMQRFNDPRPFLLLPRVPISRHCDAFVTNFTVAVSFAVQNASTAGARSRRIAPVTSLAHAGPALTRRLRTRFCAHKCACRQVLAQMNSDASTSDSLHLARTSLFTARPLWTRIRHIMDS
ncbi:hypothetical protein EVAR_94086_1 [Eumeta japonica]|uniref:Uncharacterized protein n=1 Tax=Eumeta variegata TaxID=151549 RepID=A0A4C1V5G8_EUMVA|nr:hypothetical protein EVAR_94086_1 [Eumeta japonica]